MHERLWIIIFPWMVMALGHMMRERCVYVCWCMYVCACICVCLCVSLVVKGRGVFGDRGCEGFSHTGWDWKKLLSSWISNYPRMSEISLFFIVC